MAGLVDMYGRPIESGLGKKPETREIAVAQLRDRWSSYPSNGLTPGRLAEVLRQADAGDVLRQAQLFEEMEEKDAHLASQFSIRRQAVIGLDREIQANPADPKGEEVAAFCRECIGRLANLDENLLDMLDALAKGYSLHEIMWDVSEGQAMVAALKWIHPQKVTYCESLTPRVLTEAEPSHGEDLQPFKWIYHRHKARSGYDTRAGIMRTCTWMYLFKNFTIKDWVSFSETYGQPLRVGKYSPSASEADKESLLQAVRAIGAEAAGIISKNTEIEFIQAVRTGGLNVYETLAKFCDAQMSKAILGQTLTSEAGGEKGQGSQALGKVHNDVRLDLLKADAKALGRTLTSQLLAPLVGYNFGWDRPVPTFAFLVQEPEDLETLATVYSAFIDRGQPISQEHISARFGIALPQEGETPLPGKAPTAPPPVGNALKLLLKAAAPQAGADDPTGSPVIADITQRVAQAAELAEWTHSLQTLLAQCSSLEDFRDRLLDAFAGLDPAAMADALQQALAVAQLSGRFDGRADPGGEA